MREGFSSNLGAIAGDSAQVIGLREVLESRFLSSELILSRVGDAAHACARGSFAPAPASAAPFLIVFFISCWLTRARLYCCLHVIRLSLVVRVPQGERGGVFSPTEELRIISEVEAGVNYRSAGRTREQVVEYFFSATTSTRFQVVQRLVPNLCHLDADWASGNQWARRRCAVPQGPGSGCYRVIAGAVCCPPILITSVCNGGRGPHMTRPGSRQGTTVFVHMRMVEEQ